MIDGFDAAQFVAEIEKTLEAPSRWESRVGEG